MADLHTYISSFPTTDILYGLAFSDDGDKFYAGKYSGGVYLLKEYVMTVPWDITTASYTGNSFNTGVYGFRDAFISTLGARTYILEGTSHTIREYSGVFPSLSLAHSLNFQAQVGGNFLSGMWLSEDGVDLFLTNIVGSLYHFVLSTAHDISTAVIVNSISMGLTVLTYDGNPWVSSTGKKIMYAEDSSVSNYIDIHSLFLDESFDLSSVTSHEVNRTYVPLPGGASLTVLGCFGNSDEDIFYVNSMLPDSTPAISSYTSLSIISFWTNFSGQTEITS